MKITLETVREVLREALGFQSFVATFITEVHEDQRQPTACITKEGKLVYNPRFVAKHLTCKEDLFSLIFHELLHPMFGHFIYDCGRIENIAADAVINAVISTLYPKQSWEGSLFKKTHRPRGLGGLMRPDSRMHNTRYWPVYHRLYPSQGYSFGGMTTGELIQTLKILTQTEDLRRIPLLGSHGGGGDQSGNDQLAGLPKDILGRLADEIRRSVRENTGKLAGYNAGLMELLIEALKTHLSIRRVLLQKFATKRKVDRFKEVFQARRLAVSPIPIHPSKRDIVLLAAGIYPCHFHVCLQQPQKRNRGLAIYLDVSGSVNEYLPQILGILKSLRREITTIFQFSNQVVETSFDTLLKGDIRTTLGTDFDCIARSILERGYDKAIIITDGCASMADDLKQQLRKHGPATLTVLFHGKQTCADFAVFGDVVLLEDICE